MPVYRYTGYAEDGSKRKGRHEGLDPKDVREQLLSAGVYVKDLQAVVRRDREKNSLRMRGIFYRELSALLRAAMPLDQALGLLVENPDLGATGDALAAVRDRVREGQAFSEAFASAMTGVRDHERTVLLSGEKAGRLALVCEELANVLEEEADVADRISSSMSYPIVIIVVSLVAISVVMRYLLPMYSKLLVSLNAEMHPLAQFVFGVGEFFQSAFGGIFLLAGFASLFLGMRAIKQGRWTAWDRLRFRLPVIGECAASMARVRFARTLALLSEARVPIHQAFRIAGQATGSRWLSACCEEEARNIEQGERISEVTRRIPHLSVDLPGWLAAAELSGELPGMLRHAARGHQRAWERRVSKALALLEPLLIVGVGLLILLVAMTVLQPMMQINRSLGGN